MGRVAKRKLNDFAQQSRKLLLYSHLVVGRRTMHHGLITWPYFPSPAVTSGLWPKTTGVGRGDGDPE